MSLPTCDQTGCNLVPPAYSDVNCAPESNDGEIKYVYISDADFTNMTTAEFQSRLLNDGSAGSITKIPVRGTLGEPDQNEVEMEGGVIQYGTRQFVLEMEKFDDSDESFDAHRKLQCDKPVKMWYGNDKFLHGSPSDVKVGISTVIRSNRLYDGPDARVRYTMSASWKSQYDPSRTLNPDPGTGNTVT